MERGSEFWFIFVSMAFGRNHATPPAVHAQVRPKEVPGSSSSGIFTLVAHLFPICSHLTPNHLRDTGCHGTFRLSSTRFLGRPSHSRRLSCAEVNPSCICVM